MPREERSIFYWASVQYLQGRQICNHLKTRELSLQVNSIVGRFKMRSLFVFCLLAMLGTLVPSSSESLAREMVIRKTLQLLPKKGNPRNSEGDFVQLMDGRLLFVYTHFTGGTGDHATAHLAGRYSSDGGLSWTTKDVIVIPNEGKQNVMSVSLLRLNNDSIAIFYVRKNSLLDCRPVVRLSADEARTWSDPEAIIPELDSGYYVLNNDRVVQLESGRLVVPVSRHDTTGGRWTNDSAYGTIMCYLSDDNGRTWRRGRTQLDGLPPEGVKGRRVMLQEPGVVELKGGRLMMFCRSDSGNQYLSFSKDGGESWTPFESSNIISPLSPASMERIPGTGHLLMVWNNHEDIDPNLKRKRTPLCVSISRDEGRTWENERVLENNPHGWYCYTAIHFGRDNVVLAYCAGDKRRTNGLATTQVAQFPLQWLYPDAGSAKDREVGKSPNKTIEHDLDNRAGRRVNRAFIQHQ